MASLERENRKLRQEVIALETRLADKWDPLRDSVIVRDAVRVAVQIRAEALRDAA